MLRAEPGRRAGRARGTGSLDTRRRRLPFHWRARYVGGQRARGASWVCGAYRSRSGSCAPPRGWWSGGCAAIASAGLGRWTGPPGEHEPDAPGTWSCWGSPRGRSPTRRDPPGADCGGLIGPSGVIMFLRQAWPGTRRGRGVLARPRPGGGASAVGRAPGRREPLLPGLGCEARPSRVRWLGSRGAPGTSGTGGVPGAASRPRPRSRARPPASGGGCIEYGQGFRLEGSLQGAECP